MKLRRLPIYFILLTSLLGTVTPAFAYWVWSPDLGKWVNPKGASKDSPEEQYAWAMDFFNREEWDRAIEEFEKLPGAFPTSRLAAEGVYFAGQAWEKKGDIAKAADSYQKLVDRYPYSDRIKDAIGREFDIAGQFASGTRMKVLGMPILSGQEKSIELYKHIVKNAPFGTYGDQAQFKLGEVYKMQGAWQEAQKAFQTIVDEYPKSDLVTQARYQIAYCSMQASKQSQYSDDYAQRAIEEFQGFKQSFPDDKQALEADESIKILRAKKAQTSFETGLFYDKRGKFKSAKVYYQEVATQYPETEFAPRARKRLDEIVTTESDTQAPGKPGKPWFKIW